jgi:type VI secretion system protein VasG
VATAPVAVATAHAELNPAEASPKELLAQLSKLESELAELQGESGLIRVCVDAQIVGEVISGWTGIPVGKMMKDEIATILSLQKQLGNRVIGQTYALEIISQRIQTSRASR